MVNDTHGRVVATDYDRIHAESFYIVEPFRLWLSVPGPVSFGRIRVLPRAEAW